MRERDGFREFRERENGRGGRKFEMASIRDNEVGERNRGELEIKRVGSCNKVRVDRGVGFNSK